MSRISIDCHYTPQWVSEIVASAIPNKPKLVLDPACGDGALLEAVHRRFSLARLLGIDIDRSAIDRLKSNKPKWILSVADIYRSRSVKSSKVGGYSSRIDGIVINPPFSYRGGGGQIIHFNRKLYRASPAMAALFNSISIFEPRQWVVAVVPESLLYAERDHSIMSYLLSSWKLSEVCCLKRNAFRGVVANSIIIRLVVRRTQQINIDALNGSNVKQECECDLNSFSGKSSAKSPVIYSNYKQIYINAVRGGLPAHEAEFIRLGIPFLHTSDFCLLEKGQPLHRHVSSIGRGIVKGRCVLLRRVGNGRTIAIGPLFLDDVHQLSDCVIALIPHSESDAAVLGEALRRNEEELSLAYGGTGARYITRRKLQVFLETIGIKIVSWNSNAL